MEYKVLKKININTPTKTEENKNRWNLLTPKNYEKVIWASIYEYNYRAQLDIGTLLFNRLLELKSQNKQESSLAKNIALRMLQLFFEVSDQLALVYMCVIEKNKRPVFETYVQGSNVKTKDFFSRCIRGKITKNEILKIWGLDKLNVKIIKDYAMRTKMQTVINDTVKKGKKNLKLYGNSYTEQNKETKKAHYSSSLLGAFAVKHGYKQITPNDLSSRIWTFNKSEPTIMQEIVEITIKGINETKKVIKAGSLFNSKNRDIEDICRRILNHISFMSNEIKTIALIQNSLIDDQFGALTLMSKNGILKIGRNDPCPCQSNLKWKKCHGKY